MNTDTQTNVPFAPRKPLIPAALFPLGTERSRRQPNGERMNFRSVELRIEYTAVYSKLDGFASDWYTTQRIWASVDSLAEGQLSIQRVV